MNNLSIYMILYNLFFFFYGLSHFSLYYCKRHVISSCAELTNYEAKAASTLMDEIYIENATCIAIGHSSSMCWTNLQTMFGTQCLEDENRVVYGYMLFDYKILLAYCLIMPFKANFIELPLKLSKYSSIKFCPFFFVIE